MSYKKVFRAADKRNRIGYKGVSWDSMALAMRRARAEFVNIMSSRRLAAIHPVSSL